MKVSDMQVRLTPPLREISIDVRSSDNIGNIKYYVDNAYAVQVMLKIYSNDFKMYPEQSRVTLERVYIKGLREFFRETVVDVVDDSFIIEDASYFPVRYVLTIYEANVAVEGVIKYV